MLFPWPGKFIVEGQVFYTLLNGVTLDGVPISATTELNAEGTIQHYRAYFDPSPLFSALAALASAATTTDSTTVEEEPL